MTRHRAARSSTTAVLAVLVVASGGCDLRLGLGTGLGPERELEGRYEGTFTLEQEAFGSVGSGFDRFDGTVEIRHGFGGDLSGDWRLRTASRTLRGDLEDGRVNSFDEVAFELETDFGDDALEALTGCGFVDGERRFRGSVFDGRLQVDRVARLRCRLVSGRLETLRFRLTFAGRRDRFF